MSQITLEEENPIKKKNGYIRSIKYLLADNKHNYSNNAIEKSDFIKIDSSLAVTILKIEYTLTTTLLLLSNGVVLSKGRLQDPTIGREFCLETVKFFRKVNFFEDINDYNINLTSKINEIVKEEVIIYDISAGDDFVLALDHNYRVWGWGRNLYKQVTPLINKEELKYPVLIDVVSDNTQKIIKIFSIDNCSIAISKENKIYIWGSNKQNFIINECTKNINDPQILNNQNDNSHNTKKGSIGAYNDTYTNEIVKLDMLSSLINTNMKKNDKSVLEMFTESRKLFYSYNKVDIEDNTNKNLKIEKIMKQIACVKEEIRKNDKLNISAIGVYIKTTDKRILILQDLLKENEFKLSNVTLQKDSLRKELTLIESEYQKNSYDLKQNNTHLEEIEEQIERLNNEVITYKYNNNIISDSNNLQSCNFINEKLIRINNLVIYKDSLNMNLKVIIGYLETKDKERYEKSKLITNLISQENDLIKCKFILEDMIQLILESNNYNKDQFENTIDKDKEKYSEYFKYSEQLNSCTFIMLNKNYPYMIIPDILDKSNVLVEAIKAEYISKKQNLSEFNKESLKTILRIVESKIDLILEQNKLIKGLYGLFNNLETNIRMNADELFKNKLSSSKFTNLNGKNRNTGTYAEELTTSGRHIEYIYKEMIISYLKDVFKQEELPDLLPPKEDYEMIKKCKEEYLKEKENQVKFLESRNHLEEIDAEIDFNQLVCFDNDN